MATVIATAVDVGITVLLASRDFVYTSEVLALELVELWFPLNTNCYFGILQH